MKKKILKFTAIFMVIATVSVYAYDRYAIWECPPGLYFDPTIGVCTFPENIDGELITVFGQNLETNEYVSFCAEEEFSTCVIVSYGVEVISRENSGVATDAPEI